MLPEFHFPVQVYLAVPNNCPYHPNGSKRKLSAEEKVSSSVIMYVSDDEGTTFSEVSFIPILDASHAVRGVQVSRKILFSVHLVHQTLIEKSRRHFTGLNLPDRS